MFMSLSQLLSYVDPYLARYRQARDPCARAAVASRVAEGILQSRVLATRRGHVAPTPEQLLEIHEKIAREYGLKAADDIEPNRSRQL